MVFILLESRYNREKALVELIFYNEETQQLMVYEDKTQYKPYFYSNVTREKLYLLLRHQQESDESTDIINALPLEQITKYNPLKHQSELILKIYGSTPDDIYSRFGSDKGLQLANKLIIKDSSREETTLNYAFEYNIPIEQSYLYDHGFIFGMPYRFQMRPVEIKTPKKCNTCNRTRILCDYYTINDDVEIDDITQGVQLYETRCASCDQVLYHNGTIDTAKYHHYFFVQTEGDIETIIENRLVPVMIETTLSADFVAKIEKSFINEIQAEKDLMKKWLPKFFTPIMKNMYRVAYDIEVYVPRKEIFPIPTEAEYPVSDVTFYDVNGKKTIFLLHVWEKEGDPISQIPSDIEYFIYEKANEKKMLLDVFAFMKKQPILVDFNGTNFDFPYLYFRAKKIGLKQDSIPFFVKPSKIPNHFYCTLKWDCIHFDLYKLFSNRSLKAYAFDNKYEDVGLDDVSTALLPDNQGKVSKDLLHPQFELQCIFPKCKKTYYSPNYGMAWYGNKEYTDIVLNIHEQDGQYMCPECHNELELNYEEKKIAEYTKNELVYYCLMDTYLTMELTKYNDYIVMQLLFILMRLSNTGFESFLNHQISHWLKNLFDDYHRQNNYLIPQQSQISSISTASTKSSTDKSFQGAYVIDPVQGVHFNVFCLDFASLYPSIIKTRNLSYETVDNCSHNECKTNIIPQTHHVVCQKEIGMIALIIGTVRDFRVLHFKESMKENKKLMKQYKSEGKDELISHLMTENLFFDVLQSALKVFINAGYGVLSFAEFHYFHIGVGEGTTAYGRDSIARVIDKVKEDLQKVVAYGDTDSVFIVNPTPENLQYLIDWSIAEIHVPLSIDYELKVMAISNRKKNYIGFFKQPKDKEGKEILPSDPLWKSPLIKGLKGKKSNTPPFIREKFARLVNEIDVMLYTKDDLPKVLQYMKRFLEQIVSDINNELIPLKKMAFTQQLSKNVIDYGDETTSEYNKKLIQKAKQGKLINDKKISLNFALKQDTDQPPLSPLLQAYKMFKTKGMNQAPKCALLLMQQGVDVVKGYRIKFIKTRKTYNDGAMPLSLITSWAKVDRVAYLNELKSTFGQLYDCFGLNADQIIDGVVQGKGINMDDIEEDYRTKRELGLLPVNQPAIDKLTAEIDVKLEQKKQRSLNNLASFIKK